MQDFVGILFFTYVGIYVVLQPIAYVYYMVSVWRLFRSQQTEKYLAKTVRGLWWFCVLPLLSFLFATVYAVFIVKDWSKVSLAWNTYTMVTIMKFFAWPMAAVFCIVGIVLSLVYNQGLRKNIPPSWLWLGIGWFGFFLVVSGLGQLIDFFWMPRLGVD